MAQQNSVRIIQIPFSLLNDPQQCAQNGNIFFYVRGSTTGRMNWADQRYVISRGVAAIHHQHDIALQPFVRAAIEFELPKLLTHMMGLTFPNVSAHQLATIPYPDFDNGEQRAIAHILGTLDNKIELHRCIENAVLETMARAIFQDWFVDVGPVRVKIEGRAPYLPRETWVLFPNRLMKSELGRSRKGKGGELLQPHHGMEGNSKLQQRILGGQSDANIRFDDSRLFLLSLGFVERVQRNHHIFRKAGIRELINLQRDRNHAKPYQVQQVRQIILRHRLQEGN